MNDFRAMALSLPRAVEQDHFGSSSFRVEGKIFAQISSDESEGLVKLSLGVQASILDTYPDDSRSEDHWGKYGWTRIRWRKLPGDVVFDLLSASWRAVAPQKGLPARPPPSD
jgi:hypothetical protein